VLCKLPRFLDFAVTLRRANYLGDVRVDHIHVRFENEDLTALDNLQLLLADLETNYRIVFEGLSSLLEVSK